ncbi:MAG: 4Fe-4S dicluster domain-containing protein [Thermoplasmata archaeon]|nr:4Fe-4S dicluster domain-containing protein [Thermoplasmata archaeon]
MRAIRNSAICLKDCLCLYICPTGATDTETGQIDANKCTGCGMCARACPAHAITIVPKVYPVQQPKTKKVVEPLYVLAKSWAKGELIADSLSRSENPVERQFAVALRESFRRQGEDLFREAGYMLPQSKNVREMLMNMIMNEMDPNFPKDAALKLLQLLQEQDR